MSSLITPIKRTLLDRWGRLVIPLSWPILTAALLCAALGAIVVDVRLVRALLVPATMRLLGRWNRWAPGLGGQ